MLGAFVTNVDNALAQELITSVVARASRFAPCILVPGFPFVTEARAVLLDVVVRRYDARKAGLIAGVSKAETAGGRTQSSDAKTLVTFLPSEITELRELCAAASAAAPAASTPVYSFPPAQPWPDGLC